MSEDTLGNSLFGIGTALIIIGIACGFVTELELIMYPSLFVGLSLQFLTVGRKTKLIDFVEFVAVLCMVLTFILAIPFIAALLLPVVHPESWASVKVTPIWWWVIVLGCPGCYVVNRLLRWGFRLDEKNI